MAGNRRRGGIRGAPFSGAATIYDRLRQPSDRSDAYMAEMAFMHAMQAGHTSLESALLWILDLFEEDPRPARNGMRT